MGRSLAELRASIQELRRLEKDVMRDRRREVCAYLGRAVRSVRVAAGLTQRELAVAGGLDVHAVQYIENGSRATSVATLVSLCDALNVEPADLLPPRQKAVAP